MFVNHKASTCPKRRERTSTSQNHKYVNYDGQNKRFKFPKRSDKNSRGRGIKRMGNNNDRNCDSKRPKTAQSNKQNSFKKPKGHKRQFQQNSNRSQSDDSSNSKGENFYLTKFKTNFITNNVLNERDNNEMIKNKTA